MPTASKLLIFDCRPKINGQANFAKGGGYEKSEMYQEKDSAGESSSFIALLFCDIENIHEMRNSLRNVEEALNQTDKKMQRKWFTLLDKSKWFHHLRMTLMGAARIAERIESTASSVLCHCSDGWVKKQALNLRLNRQGLKAKFIVCTVQVFQIIRFKFWM